MPNIDHRVLVAHLNLRISVYLESGAIAFNKINILGLGRSLIVKYYFGCQRGSDMRERSR
ncbi:MAG: hypothetical protein AB4426_35105 [Xenococcaceae cyanobacterium]